jgi:hypothetical protein
MKARVAKILRNPVFLLALAGSFTVAAYLRAGSTAAIGVLLGVFATVVVLYGTWGLVLTFTSGSTWTKDRLLATFALFAKLPIFGGAVVLIYRLGGPGPNNFVLGSALVYFVALGWAIYGQTEGRPEQ